MRITGRVVAEFVAERHGLTFAQLISPRKSNEIARPRQIAMYVMREVCQHLSYPAIGRILGNRDHTTVMHGVQRIEALMHTQEGVLEEVWAALSFFSDDNLAMEVMLEARIDAATKYLNVLLQEKRQAEQRTARMAA